MGKASQWCSWSRPVVGRGWHLLSQAPESWSEGYSPAGCPLRGGWEGSQRSFTLTQRPFSQSSPGGQNISMWRWPACPPTCMPPSTAWVFVLRQERDTCDPDNGLGCSHLVQLQLPQVSNVLSSAPAHVAPTPPWRMVTWKTEQRPTTGPSRVWHMLWPRGGGMRASFLFPGKEHHLWGTQLGWGHLPGWWCTDGGGGRAQTPDPATMPPPAAPGQGAPTFSATPGALLRRL